jgi:hypothetical protein
MQPILGSQLSSVHGLASLQPAAFPPAQLPVAQVSPMVQGLPSSHPAALGVFRQIPPLPQLSMVQGLSSSQSSKAPGLQAPASQASPIVQALPSLHGPLAAVAVQPFAGSHASAVHGLPSAH